MPASAWFPFVKPSPQARVRLLCLPHAGGAASGFRKWATLLPPTVEVWAAQPPGRETRFGEQRLTRVAPWVESLAAAMDELVRLPWALFGHSLGAVLGYELIRAVRAQGKPLPLHFFASGREAPDALRQAVTWNLDHDTFVARVRALEGTPVALFDHPELLQLVLPVLRADFEAYETYTWAPQPPLECAITALGGREDPSVDPAALDGWAAHTLRFAGVKLFPGGHFFVQTEETALLRFIAQRLGV